MTCLDCGGRLLDLSKPRIMGIVNVTPDSFSDGGIFADPEVALSRAQAMVEAGADIVDVGGESTRPGALDVPLEVELERVLPVVEALAGALAVPISVDTSKPEVMRAAAAAGASMINDVRALRLPGALETAARLRLPVCLVHMAGEPRTMQVAPSYDDVVEDVRRFLEERVATCVSAGIARDRIVVDPGFGFGKTVAHNLALLAGLSALTRLGLPVLVGISRKSMVGALTGRSPGERLAASLAAAVLAAERGAHIVRVHDVAETRDALRVLEALREAEA